MSDRGKRSRVVILACLVIAVFLVVLVWNKPCQQDKGEAIRTEERMQLKERVEKGQEEILSGLDLEEAISREAVRMLSEKPAPVRDGTQKARPVPLVNPA